MTDLYRIMRLERSFLSFVALLSGELAKVSTPQELELVQVQLGLDMEEMRKDLDA
jgi:hypothetical protein